MWESDYGLTPYHYSHNNPLVKKDGNGLADFYDEASGTFLEHTNDGTNNQYLQNNTTCFVAGNPNSVGVTLTKIDMNSDIGLIARGTFAEMRSASSEAKQVVAQSIVNRQNLTGGTYERGNGTVSDILSKFYDAAKPSDKNYKVFQNPFPTANSDKASTDAWRSSVAAAIRSVNGKSDNYQGALFYNSNMENAYAGKSGYQQINLDHKIEGIKSLGKLSGD